MILLATDYDGTLYTNTVDLYLNIKAIKEFREKDNLFVIATGRSFNSIKKQVNMFDIPYDYLICNDGSVIFDNLDNLISARYISQDELHSLVCSLDDSGLEGIGFYNIYDKTRSLKNIVELEVTVSSCTQLKVLRELILNNYPQFHVFKVNNKVFLRYKYFKSDGIAELCSNLVEKPNEIYTIGDDLNDVEMLKAYCGFLILHSKIHDASLKRCSSVKQLIKKIM